MPGTDFPTQARHDGGLQALFAQAGQFFVKTGFVTMAQQRVQFEALFGPREAADQFAELFAHAAGGGFADVTQFGARFADEWCLRAPAAPSRVWPATCRVPLTRGTA